MINWVFYSTFFGSYDRLQALKKPNCKGRFILFTDQDDLEVVGWEVRKVEAFDCSSNQIFLNRKLKWCPWLVFPDELINLPNQRLVYLDLNLDLSGLSRFMRYMQDKSGAYLFLHPDRFSVEHEYAEVVRRGKFLGDRCLFLELLFRIELLPLWLSENRVVVHDLDDRSWRSFCILILRLLSRCGFRDQLAAPIAASYLGYRPNLFDKSIIVFFIDNPHASASAVLRIKHLARFLWLKVGRYLWNW